MYESGASEYTLETKTCDFCVLMFLCKIKRMHYAGVPVDRMFGFKDTNRILNISR